MLDAYIIEKIRQERERKESGLQPLRIEVPRPPPPEDDPRRHDDENRAPERGVVIIDFTI